jgi:hypothetical protein
MLPSGAPRTLHIAGLSRDEYVQGKDDREPTVDLLAAAAERDELAAAWDEGHQAGHEDARAVQSTYPEPTPNPYRAEGDPR